MIVTTTKTEGHTNIQKVSTPPVLIITIGPKSAVEDNLRLAKTISCLYVSIYDGK